MLQHLANNRTINILVVNTSVLSRIFSLGEKIGSVGGREAAVVGCSYLGGSGGMPPPPEFFESSESGSEAF